MYKIVKIQGEGKFGFALHVTNDRQESFVIKRVMRCVASAKSKELETHQKIEGSYKFHYFTPQPADQGNLTFSNLVLKRYSCNARVFKDKYTFGEELVINFIR